MKRSFDLFFSVLGLLLFLPLFIVFSLMIVIDSPGGVFYKQTRVGRNRLNFKLYKFRTMHVTSSQTLQLTVGDRDPRITKVGYWLRKYKLDELPQLLNILKGEMSLVGPRPEVEKYVNMYTAAQQRVLSVKPGITDWASIKFCQESELLASVADPENFYITEIIPSKIAYSLAYIDDHDIWVDMKILMLTVIRIFRN
ncbi:sugar transferase [Pedobacter sp. SYSU D00535]|uniref:sugar transferase n=1 Tax=Pedobacter sp. SYSU D00535 TaxID=2810308 RepID=UPI001A965C4B|nr:sugar transferase [Pedobacter sp. SYSU D00535]